MANAPLTPSRLTIRFAVNGFPCELAMDVDAASMAGRLEKALAVIQDAGGTVPVNLTSAPSTPPSETPICEYHGAMKESTKRPGSWFCPHKMGDGSYCKSKA